jgi:hypothetical protein
MSDEVLLNVIIRNIFGKLKKKQLVKTFYLYHGTEEVEESGMRFFFIAATFATTCKLVQKEMRRRFAAHHIHLQFISSGTQITKLHLSNFISALPILHCKPFS